MKFQNYYSFHFPPFGMQHRVDNLSPGPEVGTKTGSTFGYSIR